MRHVVAELGTTPVTLHATPYGRPLHGELGFKAIGRAEMVRDRCVPGGPEPEVATRAAAAEDLPTSAAAAWAPASSSGRSTGPGARAADSCS